MKAKKGATVNPVHLVIGLVIIVLLVLLLGKLGYINIPGFGGFFSVAVPFTKLDFLERGGTVINNECAICDKIGTRSEGWYNIDTGKFIMYDQCEKEDCTDYNIPDMYDYYFTVAGMDAIQNTCEDNGGLWTADPNELSCFVNVPTTIDCTNDPFMIHSKALCEAMEATPHCDNSLGFFGCLCKEQPPASAPPETYTCGQGNDAGVCEGTCPPDFPMCEERDWQSGDITCACSNSDFITHPDWKPGGDMYNPHDNIFNGEEEIPEYTEGQIGTIFVTDLSWNGASGGLDGIDEKCQIHATSLLYAGFSGTWIGIAGDTDTNARTRVAINVPFYRIDGIKIADSHADLFDGSIQNPININEYGGLETGTAWTGSDGAGYYVSDNCHDWNWVAVSGYYGDISSISSSWLHDDKADCTAGKHFYCVRVS